ncbi:MAG TPA: hypothetical protein PL193_07815 [Xanthobacteraceae bacterium]|nr:hypothetical protein [Xanthobacteraceae bacterium]
MIGHSEDAVLAPAGMWRRYQLRYNHRRRGAFNSPQMQRAKDALDAGPLRKFENGFQDQTGAFYPYSVVAALAHRGLAIITGAEARAR